MQEAINFNQFLAVDIRVGTILEAEPFVEARNPSYKMIIDFGPEIGTKKSAAQITLRYTVEELIGSQILAVVNFPAKQIANIMSEVLVLGVPDHDEAIILLRPEQPAPNGSRVA